MPKLMRGRQPPSDGEGGWHFPVATGVVLHAGTEEILIKLIFEYRQRHSIAIGDIEADIDKYYCARWPQACHPDSITDDGVASPAEAPREPLLNRVARWASVVSRNMPRGGYAIESSPTAEGRAKTCLGCQKNISWRGGCGGCSSSTSKLLLEVRAMRKTSVDGNLLACSVGGWDNQTAVHLPPSTTLITDEQRAALPARCWRKQLP